MANKFDYQTLVNIKDKGRYTDPTTKGLQLLVKGADKKYWLLRFSYMGKRHELGLGSFPEVSLKVARELSLECRAKLIRGINPLEERVLLKINRIEEISKSVTFSKFALEYIEGKRPEWRNAKHAEQWVSSLKEYAFPILGNLRLEEIETKHILQVLNPIWRDITETASRVRGRLEIILAAATAQKLRTGVNPALWKGHLQAILPVPNKIAPVKHHAALAYKEIPYLFSNLLLSDSVTSFALQFLILNASRTGEVIFAKKSEIKDGVWLIPACRMKNNKEHRVPLSNRSLDIVKILSARDPSSEYIFSINHKHISNMAMLSYIKKSYPNVTVHGFRSGFRDWVSEETLHSHEVAEKALAHTISNEVERAYRRGDLFERRRLLLRDWESYCLTGDWSSHMRFNGGQEL